MIEAPYKHVYYVASGNNDTFAFPFQGINKDFVKVSVKRTSGDIIQNAPVRVNTNPDGSLTGTITFEENIPEQGAIVLIERKTPEEQNTPYGLVNVFNSHNIESSFDLTVAMLQEISDKVSNHTLNIDEFQDTPLYIDFVDESDNDRLFWLDFVAKKLKSTSFTQEQVQKVIDDAVRSAGLTVKNMEWDGKKITVSFASGSKNAVVSDNIVQIRINYVDNKYIFQYSLDGITWRGVASGMLHNDLVDRDAEDSHPISAISGLQEKLTTIDENIDKKLNVNQGAENVGKVLKVDEDGNIIASSEAAGLASVNHDATMEGAGTESSPLKISQSVLSEIAEKQPAGDYVTHEELEQGLAGKANADEVVDKTSNQTIEGQKTFEQPILSSIVGRGFVKLDSNGNLVASFGSLGSGNQKEAFMYVYNDDGTINSYLSLYYNNGASFAIIGPTYNVPTSDKNNKLASTAFVHALLSQVINDSNIGSNYVYIGDLLIQWGYTERKATIDLIKPFANTDYFVSTQNISSVNIPGYGTDLINITALNTTSFELMNTDFQFPIKWIAIGQGA